MDIPNFLSTPPVDVKTGHWNPDWHGVMSQLFSQLQQRVSNEGYIMPHQDTSTISRLNTSKSSGGLIYDYVAKQPMVNVDGTYKVLAVV